MEFLDQTPLISVVIPVYNVEDYIEDCLKSVLCQSYQNIEVLCIDDCGTDSSMKIVELFSANDHRIKIFHHKNNKGLGAARNTGINLAKGEYIFFLDSDDMLYADALKNLLKNSMSTRADVTAGRVIAFSHINDINLKLFAESYNSYDALAPSGIYRLTIGDFSSPCLKLSVVAHGRLFSSKFLRQEKLYFINKNIPHEDNGFYYKYMSCLPLVSITDIPTVQYIIRPYSIMTSLDSKSLKKRRIQAMKIIMADTRSYIYSRYNLKKTDQILYTLGCLEAQSFIFDYGRIFQLQWGRYEKVVRIFGIALYRERINSNRHKIYQVLGCVLWKNKNPLGLL